MPQVLVLSLLCATSVFSVSLWCVFAGNSSTTETQRTQRLHREILLNSRRPTVTGFSSPYLYCRHHLLEIVVRHVAQLPDHLRNVFDRISIAVCKRQSVDQTEHSWCFEQFAKRKLDAEDLLHAAQQLCRHQ